MRKALAILWAVNVLAGCAGATPASSSQAHCYVESGWLDATNGCSIRAGYPDCYLVCPGGGQATTVVCRARLPRAR